jgi:hypothetical protein
MPVLAAPAELQPSSLGEAVAAMEKLVQWMTLQELRDELGRTRPAWDELADLDDVLEDGQNPSVAGDARRHQLVQNELLRRPNNG